MYYNHNVLNTLCNIGDRNNKGGARLTVIITVFMHCN